MSNEEEYQQLLEQEFFQLTWKSIVDGLSHFHEKVLPYKDDRYEKLSPVLGKSLHSADQLRKVLTELNELDDRFVGEVLHWDEQLLQGATYSLVYLGQGIEDVASIIDSFGALSVDPFIQFSLGNEFSKKLKSTYLDTVGCYFAEWGAIQEPEIFPVHWQMYLNDFTCSERDELLNKMDLHPLSNPSFPPRHVMKWFSGVSFDEDDYLSQLLDVYSEAGIDDDELAAPRVIG